MQQSKCVRVQFLDSVLSEHCSHTTNLLSVMALPIVANQLDTNENKCPADMHMLALLQTTWWEDVPPAWPRHVYIIQHAAYAVQL